MSGPCRIAAFALVFAISGSAVAAAQYQAPSSAGPAAVVPSSLKKSLAEGRP